MKMSLFCLTCNKETPVGVDQKVDFEDGGVYRYRCKNEHEISTYLDKTKPEILFEIGLRAFVDGYYRESIATFTSALERSFELYIELRAIHEGRAEFFPKFWKLVTNQSERQLGAFAYAWFQAHGAPFEELDEAMTALRNRSIHKGQFTSKAEAEKYGSYVYCIINKIFASLISDLGERDAQDLMNTKFEQIHLSACKILGLEKVPGTRMSTAIDLKNLEKLGARKFEEVAETIQLFKANFKDF